MEDKYQEILKKIKQARKSKRINQSDIGGHLGITGQAYGKMELGRAEIGLRTFFKICNYLNIDIINILKEKEV